MQKYFLKQWNKYAAVVILAGLFFGTFAAPTDAALNYPIGMNVHLQMRVTQDNWEDTGQLLQENGIQWAREEFNWNTVQPSEEVFDFSQYDAVVEQYTVSGVHVLGLLTYSADWATSESGNDFAPPTLDAWKAYVKKVARQYKDSIQYWEIWNEPNSANFWTGTKAEYAQILQAAYDEIKLVNPDAKVVMGGTAGADFAYIQDICEQLNGSKAFDIVAVHPYREKDGQFIYSPEFSADGLEPLINQLNGVRRIVDECTGKKTKIWITEFGWPTSETGAAGVDVRTQRNYMMRYITQALTVPNVTKVFVYEFRDSGLSATDQEDHFGVVENNFALKPAFSALTKLNKQLHKRRFKKVYRPNGPLPEVALSSAGWTIPTQENAELALSYSTQSINPNTIAFDYTFKTANNSYVVAQSSLPQQQTAMIAFEAKATGGPEITRMRLEDANDEVHQYTLGTLSSQWSTYFVRPKSDYHTFWNGDGNGEVNFPLQSIALIIDDTDDAPRARGTVMLKNIQFVQQPAFFGYQFKKGKRSTIIAWRTQRKNIRFRTLRAGEQTIIHVHKTRKKKTDRRLYYTFSPAPILIKPPL